MSLATPITISQGANLIKGGLEVWGQEYKAEVKIMANMRHLWEEIFLQVENPRLLICFNGEIARGGFTLANVQHRCDRQWIVVVMRGHGFLNGQAEASKPGELPFYDVLELIRDQLRCTLTISEEDPIDYKSIKPIPNVAPSQSSNVFMDAYSIEFSTANDIPAIVYTKPD